MNTEGHMMRTRKVNRTKKSSSSKQTALSSTQKGVLDLGRALVKQLDLDPGVDTLSRWMAHYIAELIEAAEAVKSEDRPAKLKQCADAIVSLWEHRHQLPDGRRPFEDFEPILRALESLDPANTTPRYFRSQRVVVDKTKQPEAKKWLDAIEGLDYSARILIRYCLAQAAGLKDDMDLPVIRIITNEGELTNASKPDESARKELQDRISRLEAFKKTADAIASDMRRQLKQGDFHNGDS